ncbi:hypothetical protein EUX98_g7453 [Antrodiella citrinella]|uniref:Uncharacterized protein n=1 Tax=Antrodiella citrinella TaxID=2447956 RepID=A0A4S4MNE2_9APHY|nr:hypothetical protein EUX98_g7453 [Antrodiella citrinella]
MPPSIVSDAYYASREAPPSPQVPVEVINVVYPSLLTVKDDLHEEIARIFSNVPKPTLPPFTLPDSSPWDSPLSGRHFLNRTTDSAETSSSRGSSIGTESCDSLVFSPLFAHTPSHPSDPNQTCIYNNGSSGSAHMGLGFTGLSNQDGTPFDGYGILRPVMHKNDSTQARASCAYKPAGRGLGFCGEDRDHWQWAGDHEVLFDADADNTLVDNNARRQARSADLSKRQSCFSPPGLRKDILSPDLDRLFNNISAQSTLSRSSYMRMSHGPVSNKFSLPKRPVSQFVTKSARTDTGGTRYTSKDSNWRRQRPSVLHTVPLPPSTSDVFYTFATPDLAAPSTLVDRPQFRANELFNLDKDGEGSPGWTLPPIAEKPRKARF